MAPSIRESLINGAAGAAASVTTGAGTASGDVLVCFFASDFYAAGGMAAPTTPSGVGAWTLQATADLGTNDSHLKVYTSTLSSGGAKTISVSPITDEEILIGLYVVSGVTTIADGGGQSGTGVSGTAFTLPSITVTGADDLYLGASATGAIAPTTYTAPTGMTKDKEATQSITLGLFSVTLAASGATGGKTGSMVNSRTTANVSIALASTGGAATPNPRQPIVASTQGAGDPRLRTKLTLAGQSTQVNSIKFANAADAAAWPTPKRPINVTTAQPPAIRRAGGVAAIERIPVPQVAQQGGIAGMGLAGTGNQVASVLPTSRTILATAPRHRSWTAPNAVSLVKPVAQPAVTAIPELGTSALGLAAAGNAVKVGVETGTGALGLSATGAAQKVAVVGGSCTLGGATTGTGKKVASDAGSAALGLAGTGVEKKVAGATGLGTAGLAAAAAGKKVAPGAGLDTIGLSATGSGKKVAAAAGRSAFGAIGTDSGTIVRAVNGTTGLGFAATGLSAKKALPAGIAALGGATRGTEQHVAVQGGTGELGAVGRGLPQHVAAADGRAAFALGAAGEGVKSATQTGRAAAGFVQTADRTPIVVGAVHAGTVTDLADRLHVGALVDLADRSTAGVPADLATRYRAGVPT